MRALGRCMLIMACFFVMDSAAQAQPDWVKQAVREAGTLTVHTNADAIVLRHTAELTVLPDGRSRGRVRYASKILKSSGRIYGTLSEPISPYRQIKNLNGWMITSEDRTRKLPKENIVEMGLTAAAGYYDDEHRLIAAFPDIAPEVVVAFEYEVEEQGPFGLFQFFQFQAQQPVVLAQISIQLSGGWNLRAGVWQPERIAYTRSGQYHEWTVRDLAYQPEEPAMPPWRYVSPWIHVTCYDPAGKQDTRFSDWGSVARWYMNLMDEKAVADAGVAEQARQLTEGLATPYEKTEAIAAFVRDKIRYVAIEIGKNRWQPRPAPVTLRNRYGDCKDKATLMRALLEVVGIPSVPVLALAQVSDADVPVQPDLPSPFVFNHCIIGIPAASVSPSMEFPDATTGGWLFFDPTDEGSRLGELPDGVQGGWALMAAQGDSLLHRLPDRTTAERRRYRAEAQMDASGRLTAAVSIMDWGNRAASMRYQRQVTPATDQIESWRKRFSRVIANPQLSGYETGAVGDSAWVRFQLQGEGLLTAAGSLSLLKPDFFLPWESVEFTAEERFHPLWIGPSLQIDTEIDWTLPEAWFTEGDLPSISGSCGAASHSSLLTGSGNRIRYTSRYQGDGRLLPPDEYGNIRTFMQQLGRAQRLTVVLQKP